MDAYSLGQTLREAREAKELTLTSAEATLKIRRYILESFEQGDFNIPDASTVQIRGFIRNYARYLGLDEERTLQHYDSALELSQRRSRRGVNRDASREREGQRGEGSTKPNLNGASTSPAPPSAKRASGELAQANTASRTTGVITEQRRRISAIIRLRNGLLTLMLGISAIALIVYIAPQLLELQTENTPATDASIAIEGALPTLTPTPFVLPATPTLLRQPTEPPLAEQNYNGEPILVTLEVIQRVWLSFTVDGTEVWAGLVRPDEQFRIEYRAENEIFVSANNAAALVITYNGQPQTRYGTRGQSVQIRFRPNNDIQVTTGIGPAPTIEFTPTPTFTSEISLTHNTPTPSPTAEPVFTQDATPISTNTTTGDNQLSAESSATAAFELAVVTPKLTPTPSSAPTTTHTQTIPIVPSFTPTPSQSANLPPRISPTPATPIKP